MPKPSSRASTTTTTTTARLVLVVVGNGLALQLLLIANTAVAAHAVCGVVRWSVERGGGKKTIGCMRGVHHTTGTAHNSHDKQERLEVQAHTARQQSRSKAEQRQKEAKRRA